MTGPLVVLGALSALGGLLLVGDWIVNWLDPVVGAPNVPEALPVPLWFLQLGIVIAMLIGIAIAWLAVGRHPVPETAPERVSFVTRAARADLYGDAINEGLFMRPGDRFVNGLVSFDDGGVDGVVMGTAATFGGLSGTMRRWQNGFVRSYALSLLSGAVIVILAMLAVNLT
jgi:NADH-quinone oxidoreductase subunit L